MSRRPSSPSEPSRAALPPLSAGTPTPAVQVARLVSLSPTPLVEPGLAGTCECSGSEALYPLVGAEHGAWYGLFFIPKTFSSFGPREEAQGS